MGLVIGMHSHRNEGSNSCSTSKHAAIRVYIWLGVGPQSSPAYRQLECECLQRRSLSAAEDLSMAAIAIRTLKSMRADCKFALFCKDVTTLVEHNLVNATVLPRRRHLPARYEDENAPPISMKHRGPDTDTFRPTLKSLTSGKCNRPLRSASLRAFS